MTFSLPIGHRLLDLLSQEFGPERAAQQLRVMETWPEVVVYRNLRTNHLLFEQGVTLVEDEERALVLVAR